MTDEERLPNIPPRLEAPKALEYVRRLAAKLPPPALSRIEYQQDTPQMYATYGLLELLYAKFIYGLALDVSDSIEGRRMNPDTRATLAGFAGGLLSALGDYLASGGTITWRGVLSFVGVWILGKFAAGASKPASK